MPKSKMLLPTCSNKLRKGGNNFWLDEMRLISVSSWANSNVGWVSSSVTHAALGFTAFYPTYTVLYLSGFPHLRDRCIVREESDDTATTSNTTNSNR